MSQTVVQPTANLFIGLCLDRNDISGLESRTESQGQGNLEPAPRSYQHQA